MSDAVEVSKYTVTLSPTATGNGEYLQIISDDFAANIVLIGLFDVQDTRKAGKAIAELKAEVARLREGLAEVADTIDAEGLAEMTGDQLRRFLRVPEERL